MGSKSGRPLGKDGLVIKGAFGGILFEGQKPKFKFKCKGCGKEVNNRAEKLPITIRNKTKDKNGKSIDIIVGYLCLKCSRREMNKQRKRGSRA